MGRLAGGEPARRQRPGRPGDRMQRLGRVTAGERRRGAVRPPRARLLQPLPGRHGGGLAGRRAAGAGGVLFGSPDLSSSCTPGTDEARPRVEPHAGAGLALRPHVAFATPFDSLDPLVARAPTFLQRDSSAATAAPAAPAIRRTTTSRSIPSTSPPCRPTIRCSWRRPIPDLASNFENPTLMRAVGLVLENMDGFENLQTKFVLRGVPHLWRCSTRASRSPARPTRRPSGSAGTAAARPAAGTIRDFAVGAITQHFTKPSTASPAPTSGCRPTTRWTPWPRSSSPWAAQAGPQPSRPCSSRRRGQPGPADLPGPRHCGRHRRGGQVQRLPRQCRRLGIDGDNRNFEIGTERIKDHPADIIVPGVRPRDGGFGKGFDRTSASATAASTPRW